MWPKQIGLIGLIQRSAAAWRSNYIHQINRVNSREWLYHDNSTIDNDVAVIIAITTIRAYSGILSVF